MGCPARSLFLSPQPPHNTKASPQYKEASAEEREIRIFVLSWIIKGLGKCYQPLLSADNAYLDFDCSEFHKKPNLIIVYY